MFPVEADLQLICNYLSLECPRIRYSRDAEEKHKENPRYFAYVDEVDGKASPVINVCSAIDDIPPEVRIGILLHELGHVFHSLDEVEADAWVLSRIPESGYHYRESLAFTSPSFEEPVEIKNIQSVTDRFLDALTSMT